MYGIIFHQINTATGGFNDNHLDNGLSSDFKIENTEIFGLVHRPKERVALQVEGETATSNFENVQIDAGGAFFNYHDFRNKKDIYRPNPLANAQLLVPKYKQCLIDKTADFNNLGFFVTNAGRDSISP